MTNTCMPGDLSIACDRRPVRRRAWPFFLGDMAIFVVWAYFAWLFLNVFITYQRFQDGLLLLLESFIAVMFICRRRAKTNSSDLGDWTIALFGTIIFLFLRPAPVTLPFALRVSLDVAQAVGSGISIFGVLSLNRSFGIVAANRGVRTSGFYGLIRHPIYAGYILADTAYIIANPSRANIAIVIAGTFLLLVRIGDEEFHLKRDTEYQRYAQQTRWRLLPFVY